MEKITLLSTERKKQGKYRDRAKGMMPAVVYGHGKKAEMIELDSVQAERAYKLAGSNKVIGLKVGDHRAKNVVFYDVQRDALKGGLTHADFYLVRMDEVLRAEVPIHFTGESTAVYKDEGTLVKNLETVEVECLPSQLPESCAGAISVLDDFEKTVTLGDLDIPEGVKVLIEDLSTLVVKVDPPRSDEDIAELEEAVGEEVPEGVKEEEPEVLADNHEEDADRLTMK
jgi:large subunit ribosomal protein L25